MFSASATRHPGRPRLPSASGRRGGALGRSAPGRGARVPRIRACAGCDRGASSRRPASRSARAARGLGRHGALLAPGRGVGGDAARRARRDHDRHRERQEPRLQPAGARRAHRAAEAPRALPLPDEGPLPGPGARARRAEGQERPRRDLRRRHRGRAPLADPQVVEPHPDQPGHAPRGRPAAPRPLGRRSFQPPLRRRRRGARLPRRLRLARGQRPPPPAPARARVRSRAAVPARLRDDREPRRARARPDRPRLHGHRRGRSAEGRADDRALEPAADRRGARPAGERARRGVEADGRPRRSAACARSCSRRAAAPPS